MPEPPGEVPADLRVCVASANLIGESPVWSVREQALYWVDVEGRRVQCHVPRSGAQQEWRMPEATGCVGLRRAGGLVAAIRSGLAFLDTGSGRVTPIVDPEAHLEGNRFNDGKMDRAGRFFAGTKNIVNRPDPTGSIYCLHADLSVTQVLQGISCVNGIAWSPDDRSLYFCDTWLRCIYVCAFDRDTGTVGERRVFARVSDEAGYPDGLTVDAEGYVWNAHYDGWRITRYAPDGSIERVVRMPVQHVTSLTFGGADLRTLHVTSASLRLSADARASQPLAGHVLAFQPGPYGLPEPEFAG
jgi:L-arabinonolactonase